MVIFNAKCIKTLTKIEKINVQNQNSSVNKQCMYIVTKMVKTKENNKMLYFEKNENKKVTNCKIFLTLF